MALASRIAILALACGAALATAGPAAAVSPPTCWNAELWARPGSARTVELYCPRNEHAAVSADPASAQLDLLRSDGELIELRLTPAAAAPEHDSFTLHLSGPAGDADQVVQVTSIPLSTNTAPRCDPVTVAQRTSGAAPVAIEMHVLCRDDEHDDLTLTGSGPGTHVDAPLYVAGGGSSVESPFWHYLPTIASGEEHTAYHAVDALGARSADTPIIVRLGPAVDRLPECRPNPSGGGSPMPVNTRPGQARRFAIICEDADGDAITPRLEQAPARGDIVRFDVGQPMSGYWGNEVWVDVVYQPRSAVEGDDPFAIGAVGPRGAGPAQPMQMVSRALPENLGAGCALWDPTGGGGGEPVTLHAECSDNDGDPLTAAVTTPPAHGRVSAPALTVGRYGATTLGASYVPDAGFVGADLVSITLTDSYGWNLELDFPLRVGNGLATFGPMSPENLALFMAGWRPSEAGALKTPVQQARTALNTGSVRLVTRIGGARVYAPRAAPRAGSKRSVLALTCVSSCTVTSRVTVAGQAARISKLRVVPERATGLALTKAQRGRAKRMRAAGAVFRLTVASEGAKARRATVRVKLRR
jgi:hypothetical protein